MASRGIAILTRDAERAAPYEAALAPLGFTTVAMPVTRSEPADRALLARALEGDHDAIVVASARAAHALVAAGPVRGAVWAVGPATARVLTAAGYTPRLPEVADARGLATAVLASAARRVLVPRAEDGRDDGIALLRAGGVMVDEIVAYRTIAAPTGDPAIARGRELLATLRAALCVVFAPSQVIALAALVPIASLTLPFAAIGRTTAEALAAAGVARVAVAHEPTPEGLAAIVTTI